MAYAINTLFIDLDGCLVSPKLTRSIPNRVAQYAVKYLKYDVGTAAAKCREAYRRNGTNLEGFLREGHDVDPDHYHAFIHTQLPYRVHLEKLPRMNRVLNAIPASKFVFTNADAAHTERCLGMTNLADCFDGIICFETLQGMYDGPFTACKPKHVAMELALRHAGAEPRTSLLFDDQPRNVHMGMDCNVRSVLIGASDIVSCEHFMHLPSLVDLETELFSSYFS